MIIEIDQSGKIENTHRRTVVAFANSASRAIILSPKTKQTIQSLFRESGQPKIFIVKTFCLAIYLLIKPHVKNIDYMIIDKEYPGWDEREHKK